MASSSPTLARTGDAEGVVSAGRPKDLNAKRSCDEGQVNAMAVSTEPALYGEPSAPPARGRVMVIALALVAVLRAAIAASAYGWSVVIQNSAAGSSETNRSASSTTQDPLAEWAPTAVAAATKSDNFRKLALQEVQNRNFAAAVEPLRNAGAALVVVPVSPDKGVSSGLMRKIGMSFMTAALHLQNGDVDAAAEAIDQVNVGYAKLSEQLRGTSAERLGQLT